MNDTITVHQNFVSWLLSYIKMWIIMHTCGKWRDVRWNHGTVYLKPSALFTNNYLIYPRAEKRLFKPGCMPISFVQHWYVSLIPLGEFRRDIWEQERDDERMLHVKCLGLKVFPRDFGVQLLQVAGGYMTTSDMLDTDLDNKWIRRRYIIGNVHPLLSGLPVCGIYPLEGPSNWKAPVF